MPGGRRSNASPPSCSRRLAWSFCGSARMQQLSPKSTARRGGERAPGVGSPNRKRPLCLEAFLCDRQTGGANEWTGGAQFLHSNQLGLSPRQASVCVSYHGNWGFPIKADNTSRGPSCDWGCLHCQWVCGNVGVSCIAQVSGARRAAEAADSVWSARQRVACLFECARDI
jgi:hypothetical protein